MATLSSLPVGPPASRALRNPLSLDRVDSAVARSAAGFGIAFLLQSVPIMTVQLPNMALWWSILTLGLLIGTLGLALVTSILISHVRLGHSAFALAYVVAMLTWPFAVLDPSRAPHEGNSFWLYFLLTISTSTATIGFGVKLATVYVVAVPALYAVIRMTAPGGAVSVTQAVLDSVYSVILGGVISILIIVLRRAARAVDLAQQMALRRYSHAVRQHAIEAERVQVDAIVHDSVLTTLLSAARAETPEATKLAATMASNAIGHLRDSAAVAPDTAGSVGVGVVASRIADAASAMSRPFKMTTGHSGDAVIPIQVAEAIYSAAVQAMVNSLQHAGEADRRWVSVSSSETSKVQVEIGDNGGGFTPDSVPTERLGVRVSIIERVAGVGGLANIASSPGNGTIVLLRWPSPGGSSNPRRVDA